MVEDLENIKKLGIRKFVENEAERWAFPEVMALFVFTTENVILAVQ
jgi:hypothetical protein